MREGKKGRSKRKC